nr:MAG TPA: hypothetical protein [Crassvirales sp.]DAO31057.1 MAG TPA: hypothetical protein [Crassvirales sp.]
MFPVKLSGTTKVFVSLIALKFKILNNYLFMF